MRAVLKQKQKNKEGRYGWVQRTFVLNVEKRVLSAEAGAGGGRTRNYSLATASFARTWGSTMGGAGLDISWQSGHMWSLLAESADVAAMWVRELNLAIGFSGQPPSRQSTPPASGQVSPVTSLDGQSLPSLAQVRLPTIISTSVG